MTILRQRCGDSSTRIYIIGMYIKQQRINFTRAYIIYGIKSRQSVRIFLHQPIGKCFF